MGEYFLVVNPAKRQYVYAGLTVGATKIRGLPRCPESAALVLLACRARCFSELPFAGTWAGDPILVVGDEGTPDPPCAEVPLHDAPNRDYEARKGFERLDDVMMAALRALDPDGWRPREPAPAPRRALARARGKLGTTAPSAAPPSYPEARDVLASGGRLLLLNTAKRQLLSPASFCASGDVIGPVAGNVAVAFAFLICRSSRLARLELAGGWSCDPISIVRTDAAEDAEVVAAAREEYEDVSYRLMTALADADPGTADAYVERAAENEPDLVNVGNAIYTVGSETLVRRLEERLGAGWNERYRQAFAARAAKS